MHRVITPSVAVDGSRKEITSEVVGLPHSPSAEDFVNKPVHLQGSSTASKFGLLVTL